MPRLNAIGQAVMGVGDGRVSVNGVDIGRGGCACWVTERAVIFSTTDDGINWFLAVHDVSTALTVLMPGSTGANEIAAAGSARWLAYQAGRGVYGSIVDPVAGLSLSDNDGRGGAGEDGTLALIADRQAGLGLQLHATSGQVQSAPHGTIARQVHVLGAGLAIWRTDNGTLQTLGLPVPVQAGPAFGPRWVDVPGQTPWVCYWTPAHGVIAHPIDSLVGVLVVAGDQAFYHDARVVSGRLMVAYSRGQGELPHDLVTVPDIFGWPRMDFTQPVQPSSSQSPSPSASPSEPDTEDPMNFPMDEWEVVEEMHRQFAEKVANQIPDKEEAARAWTKMAIEQLVFSFPTGGWCWKSADPNRPPSKDAIARRIEGRFEGWDVLSGAGANGPKNLSPYSPTYHDLAGQHPIAVSGVNHLDEPSASPSHPEDPELEDRVEELERQVTQIRAELSHTKAMVLDLNARVKTLEEKPAGGGLTPEERANLVRLDSLLASLKSGISTNRAGVIGPHSHVTKWEP